MMQRKPTDREKASEARSITFNHLVYGLVSEIPLGMVTTYGAIASAFGDPRKAREVGWALYAKPSEVHAPAHRVINRLGELSGGWAFGSPAVQRGLLEAEGVTFLPDGRVDLASHFWQPAEMEVDKIEVDKADLPQPPLFTRDGRPE